ncbi:organic solute transporter subunit alpha-like [Seriola lalandi dorsalis]|uniref:Solute carrier family 51 member A n=1 Tax=Seriola lalandi dorsalis TaxID=1841481 RepID=A0A3B4XDW0_SERLL|nr:organic solute transporter subunit alpha-like [Seriola lalandi dorsalis]XP_056221084.1 organic solute transporter subunit alpha [Seriola aureovittata]
MSLNCVCDNRATGASMNNDSNRTTARSCRESPPFAIDIILHLDIFGIILYSILTFMAVVSMLVFIEECIYIYRKVPSNKKSIIIWVNGAAPVIATMSCLGMWIPRATMFTDMTSACYFAIVVFKFLIMMVEEVGGDQAFLNRAGRHKLKISTGPCCCCCLCLPHVAITRRSLFLLKLGSFQFAVLKIVFTILSIVLWTNGTFDLSDLTITGAAIWINPFVGILTIIALWPVAIMFMHLRTVLRTLKIIPKYAMYQLVLILSQLQTAIINILALNGTIACTPPFSAAARGYMMSQQLLILEMFIITLVTRLLYRRQYDPLPEEEPDNNENTKMAMLESA